MLSPNDTVEFTQVVLEKIRVHCRRDFSELFASTMSFDKVTQIAADEVYFELRGFIYGEKVHLETQEVVFYEPLSWWQHFKKDCFPKWLLSKFPIKEIKKSMFVRMKQIEAYPKLEMTLDPKQANPRITFMQADR